jgi:hypothetical protein
MVDAFSFGPDLVRPTDTGSATPLRIDLRPKRLARMEQCRSYFSETTWSRSMPHPEAVFTEHTEFTVVPKEIFVPHD